MFEKMEEDIERVLFSREQIDARVHELGAQIAHDYEGRNPLIVGTLRGAVIFMTDLVRHIDIPLEMDFVGTSSYGSEMVSSGVVNLTKDLDTDIEGRDVILVEDVLDSGRTLKFLGDMFAQRKPRSIEIATLFRKGLHPEITARYVGFDCPCEFIVGYGLDFDQKYRNLPYVGVLKPEVYQK